MKKGFTLAEVLITLGIIGVVASLTLPAIINSSKSIVLQSQLKSAYKIILDAFTKMTIDLGEIQTFGGQNDFYPIYKTYFNKIIDESEIDEKAKDLAKRIFLRVAKAESKVHNESLENVHFHEVGAIDSIVDIIGTAILLCKINPDVIYSSVVNDGYGFIECENLDDIFVHYSAIIKDGYKTLKEGTFVNFKLVETAKGLQALDVTEEVMTVA